MKKLLTVLSCVLVLVLLTGCIQVSIPGDPSEQDAPAGSTTQSTKAESKTTGAGSTTTSTTKKTPTTIPVEKIISETQAKALALTLADVSEDKISDYDIDLDYDEHNKRWAYEIDFNVGKVEHHIEINAFDGNVIRIRKDEDVVFAVSTTTAAATTTKPKMLTADEAKSIALKKAGVTAKEIARYFVELDYDDDHKRWIYEIDFYAGTTEYDVEICAEDGAVLQFEKETEDDKHKATVTTKPTFLPKDEVKQYAALCAGVSEDKLTDYEVELDYDDDERRWEYEITFRVGRFEYDIVIDAVSGKSISMDKEIDD